MSENADHQNVLTSQQLGDINRENYTYIPLLSF